MVLCSATEKKLAMYVFFVLISFFSKVEMKFGDVSNKTPHIHMHTHISHTQTYTHIHTHMHVLKRVRLAGGRTTNKITLNIINQRKP